MNPIFLPAPESTTPASQEAIFTVQVTGLIQHPQRLQSLREETLTVCETETVTEFIASGIRPSDAINERVDKYDLTYMNASEISGSTPYLGVHDELMVIFDNQVADIFRRDFN